MYLRFSNSDRKPSPVVYALFRKFDKKRSLIGESVADALAFTLALICVSIVIRKPECAILVPAHRTAE